MKRFQRDAARFMVVAITLGVAAFANSAEARQFDHIFVIFEENHGFDQVIGHGPEVVTKGLITFPDPATPFITALAESNGLATLYFGTTHPSLPNYISLIEGGIAALNASGQAAAVNSDKPSCYASDLPKTNPACYYVDAENLADQLETAGLSWADYQQNYDPKQPLISRLPATGSTELYAQRHNPFLYFKDVATNPTRIAKHIRPLVANAAVDSTFAAHLNDATLENFIFIVPDLCHDAHGSGPCPLGDYSGSPDDLKTLKASDDYLKAYVTTIEASKAWTENSVIFITWDENDYTSDLTCCGGPSVGGSHVAMIALVPKGGPLRDAEPHNHYSLLATIEDNFGLPRLGEAATLETLHAILPPPDTGFDGSIVGK